MKKMKIRLRIIKYVLMSVLPIHVISGAPIDAEERRLNMVYRHVRELEIESKNNNYQSYAELRDSYVRKRDISYLKKKISLNPDSAMAKSLRDLIAYIEGKWRMPEKGWANDILECVNPYLDKSELYGSTFIVSDNLTPRAKPIILAEVTFARNPENINKVVSLIQTLEPESLRLLGPWGNIDFISSLSNLEELSLQNTKVEDLTPLIKLTKLKKIQLINTSVKDLSVLNQMSNLRLLYLDGKEGYILSGLKESHVILIITKNDM
jgi:Leucine-rich repeat (LRR) protein